MDLLHDCVYDFTPCCTPLLVSLTLFLLSHLILRTVLGSRRAEIINFLHMNGLKLHYLVLSKPSSSVKKIRSRVRSLQQRSF